MANQTIIALDLSSSTVTSVTLSDYYVSKVNPVLTGYVNAGDATSATLPANTTIGSVSSTELSYLDGLTGNIQSQISSISLSGSVSGNVILPAYVPYTSGAIVFEGATADNNQLFLIPPNPTYDGYLYLQMPPQPGATDYLVSRQSTDTLTNKTFNTIDNNVFKINNTSLTNTIGTGNTVVLSTSPTITTPIITNPVINSVSLTGYTGAGNNVVLSSSPSIYQPTFSGNVIAYSDLYVGGNLQVQGSTTTINSNTLTVNDKNIELGSVTSTVIATSATIGAVSGSGPYTATITLGSGGTPNVIVGEVLTATAGNGTLGAGTVTVTGVPSTTTISVSSTQTMTAGTISNLTSGGATDLTANGGGITLKGTQDKTFNWGNSNWTSSENIDLTSGKTFKINNTTVLSASQVLGKTIGGTSTGDIVNIDGNQTLTNKTLTDPSFTNPNKTYSTLTGFTNVTGNTALTSASSSIQYFTGATVQTVTLPDNSTGSITGYSYDLINAGTGNAAIVVQSYGNTANITSIPVGATATLTCIATGNTASSWKYSISGFNNFTGDPTASSKVVLDIAPTIANPTILTGITTSSATFSLINAIATTLNIGGDATTLNLGATTGTATINNATLALANATAINATKITAFDIGSTVTTASTINIGTGVNASGVTKSINIGTNGAASSTTTINIGTSTGTTTTTLNSTTLTGNVTSMSIFNANQTTISAFGAATNLTIGGGTAANNTYNIVGKAVTSSSTVNFGTGAVSTAVTNTINIGTGNLTGTGISAINIGTGTISTGSSTVTIGSSSNTGTIRLNAPTATTVGAAGAASALPATPVGYVQISIQGTNYKIPYYNV